MFVLNFLFYLYVMTTTDAQVLILTQVVKEMGFTGSIHLKTGTAAWALAIADALNAETKCGRTDLYDWKPVAINAALQLGCDGGWAKRGKKEQQSELAMYTPAAGVAWFHLFSTDVEAIQSCLPEWTSPWSGVRRQVFSTAALEDVDLFKLLAKHTMPGEVGICEFRKAILDHPQWRCLPGANLMK